MNYFVIPGIEKPKMKPKSISFFSEKRILSSVTRYFDVDFNDLKIKSKETSICMKRQIAMYLLFTYANYASIRAISRVFDMNDHSTVVRACQSVKDAMDTDERVKNQIKEMVENF